MPKVTFTKTPESFSQTKTSVAAPLASVTHKRRGDAIAAVHEKLDNAINDVGFNVWR